MCCYSVALQIALAALAKEETCHIFSEASLPQQLGDRATVHAWQRPARQRGLRLSAFCSEFKAADTETRLRPRGRGGTRPRVRAIKAKKLKAIWLQLQQLALGLNGKHLCVKVVPWQRFLFCNQASVRLERRAHWQRAGGVQTQTHKHLVGSLANQPHLGSKFNSEQQ